MDLEVARGIAYYSHHGRRDRLGELWIEHVDAWARRHIAGAMEATWIPS